MDEEDENWQGLKEQCDISFQHHSANPMRYDLNINFSAIIIYDKRPKKVIEENGCLDLKIVTYIGWYTFPDIEHRLEPLDPKGTYLFYSDDEQYIFGPQCRWFPISTHDMINNLDEIIKRTRIENENYKRKDIMAVFNKNLTCQ